MVKPPRIPFLRDNLFTALLIALLILMVVGPVFSGVAQGSLITRAALTLVLLAALDTLPRRGLMLAIAVVLVIVTLASTWMTMGEDSVSLAIIDHVTTILFLGFILATSAYRVLGAREATRDTIRGAICVYLLMGVLFATIYSLAEYLAPGSIAIGDVHAIEASDCILGGDGFHHLIFFSFVTQTTLGYGDIVPNSEEAQVLAAFQAIAGQLFVAITVGRLVAMELATRAMEVKQKQ